MSADTFTIAINMVMRLFNDPPSKIVHIAESSQHATQAITYCSRAYDVDQALPTFDARLARNSGFTICKRCLASREAQKRI